MQGHRDLAPGEPRIASLEHRSCQLLNEKWHPAGALEYGRDGFLRQWETDRGKGDDSNGFCATSFALQLDILL
jgi:hypothetical protein